jgi:putative Mg2+ transporter-C (MgtC) family protein
MVSQFEMIARLFLAAILSGLVGYEREIHGRLAGFRTHILVCVGSTLIMLTSMYIFEIYRGLATPDPARIAAQVVSGIGFLGAGTIIRFKASVRGLTTAASLWTIAGIGLAVGSGLYVPATVTTVIVLATLFFLNIFEKSLIRKEWYKVIAVESKAGASQLEEIRSVLAEYEVEIKDFEVQKAASSDNLVLKISLKLLTSEYDEEIVSRMRQLDGVKKVNWMAVP